MTGYNSMMHRKSRERRKYDRKTRTERKKARIRAKMAAKNPDMERENILSFIKENRGTAKSTITRKDSPVVKKEIAAEKTGRFSSIINKIKGFGLPKIKRR